MQQIFISFINNTDLHIRILVTLVLLVANPYSKKIVKKLIKPNIIAGKKYYVRRNHTIRLIRIAINILTVFIIAILWGVGLQNVVLVFSSLFTIIGVALFAQWSILSNITAGIIMFFAMPFQLGDEIEMYDKDTPISGTVERILTFTIHIRQDNGNLIVLSNTLFLQKVLIFKQIKLPEDKK